MSTEYEPIDEETEAIAKKVIEAAFRVHRELGPGLLENIYERCFCYELEQLGLTYERQKWGDAKYKDQVFENAFRVDALVENKVLVELKAVEQVMPLFHATILSHMRLMKSRLGYIINFNVAQLKDGIYRKVI